MPEGIGRLRDAEAAEVVRIALLFTRSFRFGG